MANLACTLCLRKVRFSASVHSKIELQIASCISSSLGARVQMISSTARTTFAHLALVTLVKNGEQVGPVRRVGMVEYWLEVQYTFASE